MKSSRRRIFSIFLSIIIISLSIQTPARAAILNKPTGQRVAYQSISPIAPPDGIYVEAGHESIYIQWNSVPGAAKYAVYRSQVQGAHYTKISEVNAIQWATSFSYTDTGLTNQAVYYYAVTATNAFGQESSFSNEVDTAPRLNLIWGGTLFPRSLSHQLGEMIPVQVDGEFYTTDPNDDTVPLTGNGTGSAGNLSLSPALLHS